MIIASFRALAESKLRSESSKLAPLPSSAARPSSPGMFGRAYNWLTGNQPSTETEVIDDALANYIEYDKLLQSAADADWNSHMPGHYVQLLLRVKINNALIALEKSRPTQSGKYRSFSSFANLKANRVLSPPCRHTQFHGNRCGSKAKAQVWRPSAWCLSPRNLPSRALFKQHYLPASDKNHYRHAILTQFKHQNLILFT